jgi:NADH dehydrogenase
MTRILILGGGFGAVYAALRLNRTLARRPDVEVTLVSRDNFLLFTPLLHEVAAGDLNPSDIVNPIRRLVPRVTFVQGEVQSIDVVSRCVHLTRDVRPVPLDLPYDHLLLALGSETNFLGMQDVAEHSVTLTTLGDAVRLRGRVIVSLEMASLERDAATRKAMLTFVVAGGGFAGVETIGAINDLVRDSCRHYPRLSPNDVRVVQIFPGDLVLPELDDTLRRYAQRKLAERGVEVVPNTRVTGFDGKVVTLSSGERIRTATLIWTAGATPSPVVAGLPCAKEHGRLVVDDFLQVAGYPGLWAVGDCAAVRDARTGRVQPPTAQHARQQGFHVAENIEAAVSGTSARQPFRFSTIGQLASIGHRSGVASIFGVRFSGWIAWLLWRAVYLIKLPRPSKKLRVAISWILELLFSKDPEQLITVRDIEQLSRIAVRLRS